jgi:hypothetical protein
MERLGAPQTHLGLKTMIKEVDEDGDGAISFRYSSDPPDTALNFVKGTVSRDFHELVSPKPLSIPLGSFRILSKIRGDIRSSRFDTGGKFAAGVVDTGGNFAASVVDTCGKFATGVVDTGGAPLLANISTNFRKNSKRS